MARHSIVIRAFEWAMIAGAAALLAFNAWRHDPSIGYDAAAHWEYVRALSQGHLPSAGESNEYFSAPLSYAPSAAWLAAGASEKTAAKAGQWVQAALGFISIVYLRRLLKLVGVNGVARAVALLALFSTAAWWRSHAMLRPEVMLTTCVLAAIFETSLAMRNGSHFGRLAIAGGLWGWACASRQWGILVLLGVVPVLTSLWISRGYAWKRFVLAAVVCAAIALPFYVSLLLRFGTVAAFNLPPVDHVELAWTWNVPRVLDDPVTPASDLRPLEILHADVFGDYWMYFLFRGKVAHRAAPVVGARLLEADRTGTLRSSNLVEMRSIVQRRLIVDMVVVALGLGSIVWVGWTLAMSAVSRAASRPDAAVVLATGATLGTIAGYVWFIVRYTHASGGGDTVKATYLLHLLPLGAIAIGLAVQRLPARMRTALMFVCIGVCLYNLPIALAR